jgi:hypothetical protein
MIIFFVLSIHFNFYNYFLKSGENFILVVLAIWIIINIIDVKITLIKKKVCDLFYDGKMFDFLSKCKLVLLNNYLKYLIFCFLENKDTELYVQKFYFGALIIILKFICVSNIIINKKIFYTISTFTIGLFYLSLFNTIKAVMDYKNIKTLHNIVTEVMVNTNQEN